VALLLFAVGLEVSLRELRPVRRVALMGAPLQILVTALSAALLLTLLAGAPRNDAIWFGAMASLSSTMVVLKVLTSQGHGSTLASRVMIGLLVVQDLAVVPMLILLPALAPPANGGAQASVSGAIFTATAFLVVMIVGGSRILPAVLRRVLEWGSRELFLVSVVAVGVGTGYVAYRLGLSFALGAFIAGVVLSESELSHQALADVVPLRDVFSLLFFVSVGMLFDPRYLVNNAGLVAATVVILIVGKAIICGLVARAFGYVFSAPWLVGLGLAQIGEFSFVLARAGLESGALTKATYDLALSCTVVSMTVSPAMLALALPLYRLSVKGRAPQKARPLDVPAPLGHRNHVVVAGYGHTGHAVVAALSAAGVPWVVIERQHTALADVVPDSYVWGDSGAPEVLEAADIRTARALVVAIPDWNDAQLVIQRARRVNPGLFVAARAPTLERVRELRDLGVAAVVQPEVEGGIEMVRQTLRNLDRDTDDVERLTQDLRERFYAPGS
jgi:CPA2 family monovalent cation:H+ antiporter-2